MMAKNPSPKSLFFFLGGGGWGLGWACNILNFCISPFPSQLFHYIIVCRKDQITFGVLEYQKMTAKMFVCMLSVCAIRWIGSL